MASEGSTQGGIPDKVTAEYVVGSLAQLNVHVSGKFKGQYISKYLPRVFTWSLTYACGGPAFPGLFTNWSALENCNTSSLELGIQQRWRRLTEDSVVTPGLYAQMIATRADIQLGSDWMLVTARKSLHWRYAVLHSAFLMCKQDFAPSETLNANLTTLIEAAKSIWPKMRKNVVQVGGQKRPFNGDIALISKLTTGRTPNELYYELIGCDLKHRWLSGTSKTHRPLSVWHAQSARWSHLHYGVTKPSQLYGIDEAAPLRQARSLSIG